jgi:hypothetical protein
MILLYYGKFLNFEKRHWYALKGQSNEKVCEIMIWDVKRAILKF